VNDPARALRAREKLLSKLPVTGELLRGSLLERQDDPNTKEFLAWLQKYYPGGKASDIFIGGGWTLAQPLVYVLKQCGDDLSRENIMGQTRTSTTSPCPGYCPGSLSTQVPRTTSRSRR
jgi:hypothetical protein